ncbi:MAG: ATP-binding protein [Lachnospiraceae bacterium]|nr:ATP-binding protein [Lachnospiraceae bacterium]
MEDFTVTASIEHLQAVTDHVNEKLEKAECPPKALAQIDIAIDEIFSNICRYAYVSTEGTAVIRTEIDPETDTVSLTFSDQGIPWNPLEAEEPDIAASAEDRPIGGLGLFLVKNLMDEVNYEYKDGCNRLTIRKKL